MWKDFIILFIVVIGIPIIFAIILDKLTFDPKKIPSSSCYQPKLFLNKGRK